MAPTGPAAYAVCVPLASALRGEAGAMSVLLGAVCILVWLAGAWLTAWLLGVFVALAIGER